MATKYWLGTTSGSFNTAANWSDGVAPANSDTLIFDWRGGSNPVTSNLGTTLTGITVIKEKSYTGDIGVLTATTATYLTFDGGTLYYEQGTGQGSPEGSGTAMFAFGSTAAVAHVYDSSSTSDSEYFPPLLIKGTSLTVHHYGGTVGIAALNGDAATVTYNMAKGTGGVDPKAYFGLGSTITAFRANSGTALSRSSNTIASLALSGDAQFEHQGTGAGTTVTADGQSTVYWTSAGTIATLNLSSTFNRTRHTGSLTFTNANLYEGYQLLLNNGVSGSHIWTNQPVHVRCSYQDGRIELPPGDFI